MNADEEGVEVSAKTVEEAIDKALQELGLERDQVGIEILSAGKAGLLGLGGEDARVRVTPIVEGQAPTEEPPVEYEEEAPEAEVLVEEAPKAEVLVKDIHAPEVEQASQYLRDLLRFMGIEAEVSVRPVETPGDGLGRASAVLDVAGEDLGILIGRRGYTLAALQYLVNLMVTRKLSGQVLTSVDVERYKRRREESLRNLSLRMADRVKQTGRSITLEPMPAAERRIVHLALANDPQVITSSVGYGEARKVAISLRRSPPRPPSPG